MIFVDTNIFLRFVLKDVPSQSKLSKVLLERAQRGEVELWTTEWVMAELVWTLSLKKYGFTRKKVYNIIRTFCSLKGLTVENGKLLLEAFALSEEKNVGLVDALNAILARHEDIKYVVSFNKHFRRFPWLKIPEPSFKSKP